MKVYRDLEITGTPAALEVLLAHIEQVLSNADGWHRDMEAEQQLHGQQNAFAFEGSALQPSAKLFLARGAGRLHVSNVIPRDTNELTEDEYNGIVSSFYERIIQPAAHGLAVQVELGKAMLNLEDWVDAKTGDALRHFSALANKSSGTAHPLDRERWNTFVCYAHQRSAMLEPHDLKRWLVEHGGWGESQAGVLAVEYEQGRALLERYDRLRRD